MPIIKSSRVLYKSYLVNSMNFISIVIGGIMTLRYWGVCRSFALMVAHGLCSSGLFCLRIWCFGFQVVGMLWS